MAEESLRDKVLTAIKKVYDPEIPVDVYELGLIYEINVYPVNNVYVLMTLTSPACPSAEAIPDEIKQNIKEVEGVGDLVERVEVGCGDSNDTDHDHRIGYAVRARCQCDVHR